MDNPVTMPSVEQVERVLRNDLLRSYQIDIESDSTVKLDVQRQHEQMSLFMQGTAQYLTAVGPLVQQGVMRGDVAIELFAAFARTVRLGRQAEDAIDRMADEVRSSAGQPQKPTPEEQKMQLEQQKMQLQKEGAAVDLQVKQAELALKEREMQMTMQLEQAKAEQEARLEAQKAEHDARLKELTLQHEMQLAQMEAEQKAAIAARENEFKQQQMLQQDGLKADLQRRQVESKIACDHDAHSIKMKRDEEAFRADQKRKDASAKQESAARVDGDNKARREREAAMRSMKRITTIKKRDANGRGEVFETMFLPFQ